MISKSSIALTLSLKFLIHFELIFIWVVKEGPVHSLGCENVVVSASFVEDYSFPIELS